MSGPEFDPDDDLEWLGTADLDTLLADQGAFR